MAARVSSEGPSWRPDCPSNKERRRVKCSPVCLEPSLARLLLFSARLRVYCLWVPRYSLAAQVEEQ